MSSRKYYETYWNKNIKGKSQHLPPSWSEENLVWHWNFFKKYTGTKVLDAGGGDGTFLNFVLSVKKNISPYVSDISKTAINIGKSKNRDIIYKQESIEKLKYENNFFDTVFAIEVVEHLLDIDTSLYQIRRVLKKNGYFCVTTSDFNWLKQVVIASFFWNKFFYPNNPHIRFFTRKTLVEICQKHGLRLIDYKWNKSYLGIMPKGQMTIFKKV